MKRRICALALAVLLLGAVMPAPARAEEGVFAPVRAYTGQFADVSGSDWYYEAVKALYELGLTGGKDAPDRFAPDESLTVAEAVTLAARLRGLYESGSSEAALAAFSGDGGAWYLPYAAYLQDRGALGEEFAGAYDRPATRAEMAHILANALPPDLFPPINQEAVEAGRASGQYITDVDETTPYRQDILLLYVWGVLGGVDGAGSFRPEQPVSRCQTAAIAARLAYGELRVTLDWPVLPPYSRKGATMASLVTGGGTFYDAPYPDETEKIAADVRYMLSRGQRRLTLQYEPDVLTDKMADALTQAFLYCVRQYVEQTYNYVVCTNIRRTGYLSLTFSSSLYGEEQLEYYRERTMDCAIAVHDRLWEEGTVTANMSEYEKARAYFTWICDNCRYDFVGGDTSMSHSGYRVFTEGLAVCDGYTAAYNLLLKLEGIDCGTWSTENHIWTVARLDGQLYHIDTTWGDQTGSVAYQFFGMSEEASLARLGVAP